MINLRDKIGTAANHASERVCVSAEKLGRAVNNQIRAEIDRLLIDGRGKRVVDNHPGLVAMSYGSQSGEIDHFDSRVCRAFQIHHLASLADCRLDCFVIAGIAQRHFDAKPRQKFDKEFIRPSVAVLNRNDAIPGDSRAKSVLLIAAMPLEKLVAASAVSRFFTLSSKAATVGFVFRL